MRPGSLRRPPTRQRLNRQWNWTAIAAVVAALAAVAGVYYTGQSLNATQAQNAVAVQSQMADRFTTAVDQLDRSGPNHLQARLGAIYALERLTRDSPQHGSTIVEVLSAFIRTNALHKPLPGQPGKCPDQRPAADIQAALTVLGRRDILDGLDSPAIDIWGVCLLYADLSYADLTAANLTGSDLTRANLTGANLTGASLGGTTLIEASLQDANLTKANVAFADFSFADLCSANLTGAHYDGATNVTGVRAEQTLGARW